LQAPANSSNRARNTHGNNRGALHDDRGNCGSRSAYGRVKHDPQRDWRFSKSCSRASPLIRESVSFRDLSENPGCGGEGVSCEWQSFPFHRGANRLSPSQEVDWEPIAEVCRQLAVADLGAYRRKEKFDSIGTAGVRGPKHLEYDNSTLSRLVSDLILV
jgi:hypothetical protein